MKINRCKMDFS